MTWETAVTYAGLRKIQQKNRRKGEKKGLSGIIKKREKKNWDKEKSK